MGQKGRNSPGVSPPSAMKEYIQQFQSSCALRHPTIYCALTTPVAETGYKNGGTSEHNIILQFAKYSKQNRISLHVNHYYSAKVFKFNSSKCIGHSSGRTRLVMTMTVVNTACTFFLRFKFYVLVQLTRLIHGDL